MAQKTLLRVDPRKELKHLYNPPVKAVEVIDVPAMNFLMVDGHGDPNTSQEYKDSLQALYNMSFTMKFTVRRKQGIDYPVMALEGLWWSDDQWNFDPQDKDSWKWTSMIMQPKQVTQSLINETMAALKKRKELPGLSRLRFESFLEGLSVQTLHVGPYSTEAPTIKMLHDEIHRRGFKLNGKHHEVYLSDPRRAAPNRLKTIIRQPVSPPK